MDDLYTLAIDDIVEVPFKFTLKEGRINRQFSCTLIAKRATPEEIEAEKGQMAIAEFLPGQCIDWRDQRLVLDQSGQPAEFSPAALKKFLGVPGVFGVAWAAYQRECGAKEKN